jgi:hypothetical protein
MAFNRSGDLLLRAQLPDRPAADQDRLSFFDCRNHSRCVRHLNVRWRRIWSQIYRPFRVVFVVGSVKDPEYAALRLVAAHRAISSSPEAPSASAKKYYKLLAALRTLHSCDAAIVFGDADIVRPADWLMRLVRPRCNPANDAGQAIPGWCRLMSDGRALSAVCARRRSDSDASCTRRMLAIPLTMSGDRWAVSTLLTANVLDHIRAPCAGASRENYGHRHATGNGSTRPMGDASLLTI